MATPVYSNSWQEIFDAMLPPLENAVLIEQDKVHFLEEKIEHHRKELNSFRLKGAWNKLKDAEKEYAIATSEFKKAYTQVPEGAFDDKTQRQEGAQLRIAYQMKKSEFESVYRDVLDAFIQNDGYKEQVSLLSKLILNRQWIEEESQDLLQLLYYNGFLA